MLDLSYTTWIVQEGLARYTGVIDVYVVHERLALEQGLPLFRLALDELGSDVDTVHLNRPHGE